MKGSIINAATIFGGDDVDTSLLRSMALESESYMRSFSWCRDLSEGVFVAGYGGIFALLLFRVDIEKAGDRTCLWVFTGDVPFAYLEANEFKSPFSAAKRYLDGVSEWISAIRLRKNVAGLIPITSPIDDESLQELEKKIETLETLVLPYLGIDPVERLTKGE